MGGGGGSEKGREEGGEEEEEEGRVQAMMELILVVGTATVCKWIMKIIELLDN